MKAISFVVPACLLLTGCGSFVSFMFDDPNPRATVSLMYEGGAHILAAGEERRLRQEAVIAKRWGDHEVCGSVMLNQDGKIDLIFALNTSREAHSYLMTRDHIARMNQIAKLTQRQIIGSFHSHPTNFAVPSSTDIRWAKPDSLMMIHSVPTGRTRLWQITDFDGVLHPVELDMEVERDWTLAPAERRRQMASRLDHFRPSETRGPRDQSKQNRAVLMALPVQSPMVPLRSTPAPRPLPVQYPPEAISAPSPVPPLRDRAVNLRWAPDAPWSIE